jgi:hypothetical protein
MLRDEHGYTAGRFVQHCTRTRAHRTLHGYGCIPPPQCHAKPGVLYVPAGVCPPLAPSNLTKTARTSIDVRVYFVRWCGVVEALSMRVTYLFTGVPSRAHPPSALSLPPLSLVFPSPCAPCAQRGDRQRLLQPLLLLVTWPWCPEPERRAAAALAAAAVGGDVAVAPRA